jgi:hypothetical protein
MSNCHSKYSNTNYVDSDDISFYLRLIDEFSKKNTKTEYRLRSPLIYPLNYLYPLSIRSYDRESVKKRVRRRIKIIRLKNTLNI